MSRKRINSVDRISEEIIEDVDLDDNFLESSQDKLCLGHGVF